MIEVGTITAEAYRRQGYAAVTCAHLIRECEARGYRSYWNCSKDNQASAGLARRLGYQTEKDFRYYDYDMLPTYTRSHTHRFGLPFCVMLTDHAD